PRATATTALHVQKLLRQADEVVFCFDGDEAGRRAAWRALEVCLAQLQDGKQVKFLFLPDGDDPDTFVRENGKTSFEERLKEGSVPLSAFMRQELCDRVDRATMEGRAGLLESARPLIAQVSASFLKEAMIHEFSKLGQVDPATLAQKVGAKSMSSAPIRHFAEAPRKQVTAENNEKTRLAGLLAKPELISQLDVETEHRSADDVLSLLREVVEFVRSSSALPSSAGLVQQFSGGPYDDCLAGTLRKITSDWAEGFDVEAEFRDAIAQIRKKQRAQMIRPLIQHGPTEKWTADEAATYVQWEKSAKDVSSPKAN